MKKSMFLVMVVSMIAATEMMTACSAEDNPVNSQWTGESVTPTENTAKIIGGWSETERRKVNADGSLQSPIDWSSMIGGEPYNIEITTDSIYFFLGNYTYADGYLAYHYTYDAAEQNLHFNGYSTIHILDLSDNSMKVLQEGFQIIYTRMNDESLKWYREHFSKNLKDF